jgi:hypothetical protein
VKTAIYIEDGVVQLVLTPQSDFEKNALSTLKAKPLEVKLFDGSFYDCRGGWIRQNAYYDRPFAHPDYDRNDHSLIL